MSMFYCIYNLVIQFLILHFTLIDRNGAENGSFASKKPPVNDSTEGSLFRFN